MNSVIIAYDRNRGDDYKPLINELERLGAKRLQFSLWEIKGRTDARAIGQHLTRFLNTGDRLDTFSTGLGRFEWPHLRRAWANRSALGGLGQFIRR